MVILVQKVIEMNQRSQDVKLYSTAAHLWVSVGCFLSNGSRRKKEVESFFLWEKLHFCLCTNSVVNTALNAAFTTFNETGKVSLNSDRLTTQLCMRPSGLKGTTGI